MVCEFPCRLMVCICSLLIYALFFLPIFRSKEFFNIFSCIFIIKEKLDGSIVYLNLSRPCSLFSSSVCSSFSNTSNTFWKGIERNESHRNRLKSIDVNRNAEESCFKEEEDAECSIEKNNNSLS